jgi:hypothetical protein
MRRKRANRLLRAGYNSGMSWPTTSEAPRLALRIARWTAGTSGVVATALTVQALGSFPEPRDHNVLGALPVLAWVYGVGQIISVAALAGLSFLVAGDLPAARSPLAKVLLPLAGFCLAGLESLVAVLLVSLPILWMGDHARIPNALTAATWCLAGSSELTALSLLVLSALTVARRNNVGAAPG